MVVWDNPLFNFFVSTPENQITRPTRVLQRARGTNEPDYKNTNPNILKRYVNGQLTEDDLWPWPYEDLIKTDFGMEETITEYVRNKLAGELEIPTTFSPSTSNTGTTQSTGTGTTTNSDTGTSTNSGTNSGTGTSSGTNTDTSACPVGEEECPCFPDNTCRLDTMDCIPQVGGGNLCQRKDDESTAGQKSTVGVCLLVGLLLAVF